MPVTNLYDGNVPTYDADEDVWGFELNTALGDQIKPTLDDYATAINANETTGNAALPKSGGTMTGDQVLADVGPGSQFSAGFRGLPVVAIDANRTFLLTDAGKMIRLSGSTNRTWTIPPVGSVGFPVGTVIVLRAGSTGEISIARGSGVTLRMDGDSVNANRVVAGYGKVALVHEASNVWTVSGVGLS